MNFQESTVLWTPGMKLDYVEERVIKLALQYFRNNKTATANSLGIAARTLDYKLEKYLEEDKKRERLRREQQLKRDEFLKKQRGNYQAVNEVAGVSYATFEKSPLSKPAREQIAEEQKILEEEIIHENEQAQYVYSEERNAEEPVIVPTTKYEVSLPVGEEVQEVLPRKATKSSKRGRSK